MKEVVLGTSNPAKTAQLRSALAGTGLQITSLLELGAIPKVIEDGQTARENAKKKAVAYAAAFDKLVLSMDNALYLDGLAPEKQPGIHVRRIEGRTDRPSDQELLEYYQELITDLGGSVNGRWEFAVCIATPQGKVFETTFVEPRIFVSTPSPSELDGYPIERLQIDERTGKYVSEMSEEEKSSFWKNLMGKELTSFVRQSLDL